MSSEYPCPHPAALCSSWALSLTARHTASAVALLSPVTTLTCGAMARGAKNSVVKTSCPFPAAIECHMMCRGSADPHQFWHQILSLCQQRGRSQWRVRTAGANGGCRLWCALPTQQFYRLTIRRAPPYAGCGAGVSTTALPAHTSSRTILEIQAFYALTRMPAARHWRGG